MLNNKQTMNEQYPEESICPQDIAVDKELDVRADRCPLPLLKAKLALSHLSEGQVLKVLASDRGTLRDFPAFSRISGHQLLLCGEFDGICVHILRKKLRA